MPPSRETHARKSFRLFTLGGAALVAPDGTPVAEQRRRVAVLVLVATGGSRGTSRDKLIATLSPDSTTDSARHALHQLLYYLRRQVGEDAFVGTDPLRLNPRLVTFDVDEFEEAIARGALEEAAALYRGPFLDGFHLGDSAEFEEWAANERLRLAVRYADVLVRLAREREGSGDYRGAAAWWRRLVGLDPLNAPAAVGLMRALAAGGDRSGALLHGEQFQQRLSRELGAPPDPSIAELLLALRVPDGVSLAPSSPPRPWSSRAPSSPPGSSSASEPASEPASELGLPRPVLPEATVPVTRMLPRRRAYGWPVAGIGVLATVAVLMAARRDAPTHEVATLGVVPIANTAGDSLDYLAAGITTSAVNRLNRGRSVRVITVRDPSWPRLPGAGKAALGRRVAVRAILSGTLTRERDTLWLRADLVRSADGAHLAGGRFAVTMQRLATVESDLLDSVAVSLGLARIERDDGRARDPEVVATLMRAEYYFGKRDTTSMRRAFDLYRQAIDHDGGSSEAYAGLSSVYGAFAYYAVMPAPAAFDRMRAAAQRALDLDPANSQAIANLAHEDGMRFWDWARGERGLRDAIRLEPWRAGSWMLLGTQLRVVGRFDEALAAYRKARDLDPLARHYAYQVAHAFTCAGEPDSALAALREAIALGSPFAAGRNASAAILASIHRYDEAIEEWRTVARESGDSATLRALADVHGKDGYDRIVRQYARSELAELMSRPTGAYVPAMELAAAHATLGDTALALDWLERASEAGDPNVAMVGCHEEFDALRDHPRFTALLRKMHLTPATFGRRPRLGGVFAGVSAR